jgi:hypothetical protein
MDYFKSPPGYNTDPPTISKFRLSNMTPFGGRLTTEVIGCKAVNPKEQPFRTQYYPTQYGYNVSNADHKFIRMRLNNGILPLDSIRGGACQGRTDGLCSMKNFMKSQSQADELANYQYSCFGNYTPLAEPLGYDYDGSIFQK